MKAILAHGQTNIAAAPRIRRIDDRHSDTLGDFELLTGDPTMSLFMSRDYLEALVTAATDALATES